eukprot:TRINITY_DN1618_c0_g1_i1.p2 TRINITY_DN1618_c0_g1~~TRINITY_DN1618_c0_g1_i1.p2  ORF type:complete len:306 (+),score=30.59 TRINITY_DN1618_c0_g1_i1:5649-6566(+)
MKQYLILLTFFLCACTAKNNEKDIWAGQPTEIKYSKEREKEVWGHVLYNTDPAIFYGTPVYEAALAIKEKESEKLKRILTGKPDSILNYQEEKGKQTLNMFAIRHNDLNSLKVLTELGADPNIQSKRGVSAFFLATEVAQGFDDNNFLKYLIKHGGDVNAVSHCKEKYDITPLIIASDYKLENVKMLIEAGADPHYVYYYKGNGGYKQSALHAAVLNNRIDIVNYLIFEQGVDYCILEAPPTKERKTPWTIVNRLRSMVFPLDSKEYQQKMKLVAYLKERGLDYWKTPIPRVYYQNYDSIFLSKY